MNADLQPGDRRIWNHNGCEIDIVRQRTEDPFAGEWEYRQQDGREGILSAANLLDGTSPVTSTPAPSDDTTPSLVQLDREEVARESLIANAVAWANGPVGHKALEAALRLAVTEYEAVAS